MYSDLECGICYQPYNAGRQCPRELHCKHSFCESCLLALSRPRDPEEGRPGTGQGQGRSIVCPLCRRVTSIPGERMTAALGVDERVLGRLVAAGVLAEEDIKEDRDGGDEGTFAESQAEERDSSPGSRGGRLRRCCRRVWGKITGKTTGSNGANCMTNEDLRDLVMMSCCTF
ncbi:RING finger protein 227 [Diretmus argenteus]